MNIRKTLLAVFVLVCSSIYAADDTNLYTFQTLNDNIIRIPVADLMVPKGFTPQVTSQWERFDGSFPGHEVIGLQNADNSVGIYIFTNESYYYFQKKRL